MAEDEIIEDPGSDAVGFVNKFLNEKKEVESGLSGLSMRLQVMAVELESEVEEWLEELRRVTPFGKSEAISVGRLMGAIEDEVRGMTRRASQRKEEEPEALLLFRLETMRKHMNQVQIMLLEAQDWDIKLNEARTAVRGLATCTENTIEVAEAAALTLERVAESQAILSKMPGADERKTALSDIRDDLEAALRPQLSETIASITLLDPSIDEATKASARTIFSRLALVYEKMDRRDALRTAYANARPAELHRSWFSAVSIPPSDQSLTSFVAEYFHRVAQLAKKESTFVDEKTAAAIARAALAPLTASYADALTQSVLKEPKQGLADAINCKALGLDLARTVQSQTQCTPKDALQVGIAAASAPFETLCSRHYAPAEYSILAAIAINVDPPTARQSPESLGLVLKDAVHALDLLFVDEIENSLNRCHILTAGFAGEHLIAAIRAAAAKRLDTLATRLMAPLTASLVSTEGLPLDPSLVSDCWAYAKRGFFAVALAGRAERMSADAMQLASTKLRAWAQQSLQPGQKENLLAAPLESSHFTLFEAKMRLQRDPSARVGLARLKSTATAGSPLDRLELEASIDQLAAASSALAFKLAFAPVRAALRRVSATRAPFDADYDTNVIAYCEPAVWCGTSTIDQTQITPSHFVTVVGEHLASALAELEFDQGADLEDALACRLDAAGRATDGAEWESLGDALELNDADRHGLRYLASGDPIEGLTLPRRDAQAELDAISADAHRQAADDDPAQRFATRWLTCFQRATVAAFIDELIRVPNMDDQGAAQLSADLTYLKHVLSLALDIKPHALLDHLLVLSQASTKRELDDIIRRPLPPNSTAANVLTKIEIAFATTRACTRL